MSSSDNNAELFTCLGSASAFFLASSGSVIAWAPAWDAEGILASRDGSNFKECPRIVVAIIIAGVLAIYGFIIASILANMLSDSAYEMTAKDGYKNLSAGLVVGLSCVSSGYSMSKFLNHSLAMNRPISPSSQATTEVTVPLMTDLPRNALMMTYVPKRFVFVMVFLEAIGMYGFLLALSLVQ